MGRNYKKNQSPLTKGLNMKRREFLKSTLLFAAVSTVVGKAAGLLNVAHAVTWAAVGKLGYKEVSPQKAKGKECATCKHYVAGGEPKAGKCTLPAMMAAMKSKEVFVKEGAYCNMWAKKA
jgi:hypothetical protein